MIQRLVEALVRILVADVLADDVDGQLVLRVLDPRDQVFPGGHPPLGLRQVQQLEHDAIEAFGAEHERHFVDRRHVLRRDDGLLVDVAEQRDLALDVRIEEPIGPAQQDVGLDADRPQVAHAVLRRLGLELAGGADERHQRQVHVERVVAADVLAELADRLEEGQALDVADRPADLDQGDVDALAAGADRVLDFVGDVRNDLHRASEVVAAAFLLNHALVDLARRPVRIAGRGGVREPLVVAEIEVGLAAVVGDVDLAVLIRAHRAGVDVDVGVELLQPTRVAVALEQAADGRGGEALAERRDDAAGHEDVLGGSSVGHDAPGSGPSRTRSLREGWTRQPTVVCVNWASAPPAGGARVRDPPACRRRTSRTPFPRS